MIVALTGRAGSGKSSAASYLVKKYDFTHVSSRNFLSDLLKEQNKSPNRENLREIAHSLRRDHGPDHVARCLLKIAKDKQGSVVIDSIRTTEGARYLLENNVPIWHFEADLNTRYEYIRGRASETDDVSFEDFSLLDESDVERIKSFSKVHIHNNKTKEHLFTQVDSILAK